MAKRKPLNLPLKRSGEEVRVAFAVKFKTGNRAVVFRYHRTVTSLPRALRPNGKFRRGIECLVCRFIKEEDKNLLIVEHDGFSFCRPPDKFNMEEGCRRALKHALRHFHRDCDSAGVKAKLWEKMIGTKGWRRVNVIQYDNGDTK